MKKRDLRQLLHRVCLASLLAFFAFPASAQEKVVLRVDWVPGGVHAPLHLALVKGWFKEAGLDVELQDGKGSQNTVQLVATGAADVGQITTGILPLARESGMKVKAVAGIARRNALAVLVPKDSPMRTAKDLAGKRVLLFAASPWTPFVDPFFKAAGMTRNDVQMVFVDPAALVATYAAGKADAMMTLGPAAAHLMKTRPSRAIPADEYGIAFPDHGLVVTEDMIKNRPHVVRKVVDVTIRAWTYTMAGNEDEAIQAIFATRPNHNLDRGVLKEHLALYREYVDTANTKGQPFGWQSRADWEAALKSLVASGILKPGQQASDIYTNEFIAAKPTNN